MVLWGHRLADAGVPLVEDCALILAVVVEEYDGADPVNLGTGVETPIRELAETIASVTGFEGGITWDTSMPNGTAPTFARPVARRRAVRVSCSGSPP